MALEKKHWIWIGVGAAVLTLTGIIIHQKRKKKREEAEEKKKIELTKLFLEGKGVEEKNNAVQQPEQQSEQTPTSNSTFPLQKGSDNYEVKVLQSYMNSTCKASLTSEGVYPLKVDGIWGVKTEAGALKCSSVKRNSIEPSFFNLMYRALDASKTLPK